MGNTLQNSQTISANANHPPPRTTRFPISRRSILPARGRADRQKGNQEICWCLSSKRQYKGPYCPLEDRSSRHWLAAMMVKTASATYQNQWNHVAGIQKYTGLGSRTRLEFQWCLRRCRFRIPLAVRRSRTKLLQITADYGCNTEFISFTTTKLQNLIALLQLEW